MAKNRAPSVYYNAIEQILLTHIYQLMKAEGEGDNAEGFVTDNDKKDDAYVYDGNNEDEDEDISKFAKKGEDEEDDEMDEDESDEDSNCDGV